MKRLKGTFADRRGDFSLGVSGLVLWFAVGLAIHLDQVSVYYSPLGRVGQPKDIADVAAFSASDDARSITGEIILASGSLG
jgi:NAD(P)-dependent dehydrogenase (short-subunit alcohol dehydrogenase family)